MREAEERVWRERAQKAREEQERIHTLEADVANWVKSQQIREYVDRVEEQVRLSGQIEKGSEIAERLAWARRYADRVDPLIGT